MAGIYLHIPFCKKACHYCDFHFSTSLQLKEPLLTALKTEIELRKDELEGEKIETIYFGGGTPSLLAVDEIKQLIETIYRNYAVEPKVEVTLEANPDDLTGAKLKELRTTLINRFSIGVQSFFDEDLLYMNRAHNASESERAIKSSQDAGFENLTIDLIYGTPTLSNENWAGNLRKTISLGIPHISCYALTVEEKTPLAGLIKPKKWKEVDDHKVADHFVLLTEILPPLDFEQYEISNFAKPGFRSKHNASYWAGKSYIGFGPSAHSFDGFNKRRWNISNNALYIKNLNANEMYYEEEWLNEIDRFNEFIMTRIRLIDGISLDEIDMKFGTNFSNHLRSTVETWDSEWYALQNNSIVLQYAGKIISDKLVAGLFLLKS